MTACHFYDFKSRNHCVTLTYLPRSLQVGLTCHRSSLQWHALFCRLLCPRVPSCLRSPSKQKSTGAGSSLSHSRSLCSCQDSGFGQECDEDELAGGPMRRCRWSISTRCHTLSVRAPPVVSSGASISGKMDCGGSFLGQVNQSILPMGKCVYSPKYGLGIWNYLTEYPR